MSQKPQVLDAVRGYLNEERFAKILSTDDGVEALRLLDLFEQHDPVQEVLLAVDQMIILSGYLEGKYTSLQESIEEAAARLYAELEPEHREKVAKAGLKTETAVKNSILAVVPYQSLREKALLAKELSEMFHTLSKAADGRQYAIAEVSKSVRNAKDRD